MKKVLCTFAIGDYEKCLDLSRDTFRNYCYTHGYAYVEADFTYKDLEYRPASWGKVLLMHELLDNWDLVVWIDCDALIIDSSVDIADVIPEDKIQANAYHLFEGVELPTAGTWVAKKEMQPYLRQIWKMTKYTEHPWWEQAALQELLGFQQDPEYLTPRPIKVADTELAGRSHILNVEWAEFQYKDFTRTSKFLHFPAGDVAHRTEWMQKWITKLANQQKVPKLNFPTLLNLTS